MKKVFIKEYQALSPTSGSGMSNHINVGKIMDPERMVREEFKYQTESKFGDTSHLIGTMHKCGDLVTFQLYRYGNSC